MQKFFGKKSVFPCISVEAVNPNCGQKGYDKFTLMVLLHSLLARVPYVRQEEIETTFLRCQVF